MHDCSLDSLVVEWEKGIATILLKSMSSSRIAILVNGLRMLTVPRLQEWGHSVSINEVSGPSPTSEGNEFLKIEMQSGDVIEIEGSKIEVPTVCD